MATAVKKELSPRQFGFLMFNYVVGFGFIATIGQVMRLGGWGIFVFFVTAFIAFGVMLTFARLSQRFPEVKGASYGYAKLAHKKPLTFLQGWNQYVQGPVIGITTPLFLEQILDETWPDQRYVWKGLSIGIFLIITGLSLFEFKKMFKILRTIASVKWIVIFVAFVLAIIISAKDSGFSSNWLSSDKASAASLTGAILSFIFAFGGVEGIASLVNRVNTTKVKRTFFLTFAGILTFYLLMFIIVFGINILGRNINLGNQDLFRLIYNVSFGATGVVLFTIGLIANKSSSILNGTIVQAEVLAPLATDGYVPSWIGRENAKGVKRNAIFLSAFVTLIVMAIFQILGTFVDSKNPFLNVVNIGTICFFFQYFFTAFTLLKLAFQKQMGKIPLWEYSVLIIMMGAILFILLTQMVPPIFGNVFDTRTIVIDCSFAGFMVIGYGLWGLNHLSRKVFKRKVALS